MTRTPNLEYLTLFRCWKCHEETDLADARDSVVLDENRKVLLCSSCKMKQNGNK